jgi:hypothetical protein
MQSSEVSDQLIAILKAGYPKNHNLDIRIACLALAQLGPAASDAVVPALLDILKEQLADTSPGLPKKFDAWASILALGRIGEKAASAIPLLQSLVPLQAIKSPIYDSDGLYAVMALGDIGALAMPAVPDIILVLKAETNKDDAQIEVNALKEITEQDFGADAARWGSWWQAQTP